MNLNEFKAWLEGFEESFAGGPPTGEQWAKIKDKIASLQTAVPVLNSPNWRDLVNNPAQLHQPVYGRTVAPR